MLLRCVDAKTFILPDGRTIDSVGLVAMREELPAFSRSANSSSEAELIVCTLSIPAHKCLLAQVPVGKREAKVLRKTLLWTFEEALLEPAEAEHFAIGVIAGGSAAVCVVNKSWFEEVLANLAAAGIRPTAAVPEILLVPWQPGQWSLLIEDRPGSTQVCLVRFSHCEGVVCSLHNLQFILQAKLNEHADSAESVVIFADAATASVVRNQLPALLQSRVETRPCIDWMKLEPAEAELNLLQDEFAPRLPWQRWWKQWRLVAMLAAALLATDLVATILQTAKVERTTSAIETDIVELFQSVQPEAAVIDPQLQLERAVATLGGDEKNGFTELLERMAPALESSAGIEVQNLDYDSGTGELQMVIVSEGFAAAETLRAQLQNLGLDAELLGSSSEGARNRSRLRVGS